MRFSCICLQQDLWPCNCYQVAYPLRPCLEQQKARCGDGYISGGDHAEVSSEQWWAHGVFIGEEADMRCSSSPAASSCQIATSESIIIRGQIRWYAIWKVAISCNQRLLLLCNALYRLNKIRVGAAPLWSALCYFVTDRWEHLGNQWVSGVVYPWRFRPQFYRDIFFKFMEHSYKFSLYTLSSF